MFARLGSSVTGRPWWILAAGLVFVALAGSVGGGVAAHLKSGGFDDPASASSRAQAIVDGRFGGSSNVVLLVTPVRGTVDDPATAAVGRQVSDALAATADMSQVVSYWTAPGASGLASADRRQALAMGHLSGTDEEVVARSRDIVTALQRTSGPVLVRASGQGPTGAAITAHTTGGLARAEMIAIPLTLVLLVVAFGSVVAAFLPLLVGVVAIMGTFLVLSLLTGVTDVSIYALNLTTALGLGLGIDYALLSVSRFREETAAGADPTSAVRTTVATAGRTIAFSAATVIVALCALLVFPQYFLRSFAYAGMAVVAVAAVSAALLLPAVMTLLGSRVDALRLGRRRNPSAQGSHFWRRLASAVTARPVLAAVPVLLVLLGMGLPFLKVSFGLPDDRVVPTSVVARQVGDVLRADFSSHSTQTLRVVSVTGGDRLAGAYAARLSAVPAVAAVQAADGTFAGGHLVGPAQPGAVLRHGDSGMIVVVPTVDGDTAAGATLVSDLRAVPAPAGTEPLVGGYAAYLADAKSGVAARLPYALGIVVLATLVVLFLFTGSVLIPVKAVLLNTLSMFAVLGVLVWIFQQGHLSGLLGFTPTALDTSMPMLLLCIVFGLSMDYEVFLLGRIVEAHGAGMPTRDAIIEGVARTGRTITVAACLLAVTFFAFATADVSFLKLFGIGAGLAVILDATLVRGVLVPALMGMLGEANWWAPRPLRWLHARVGLGEAAAPAAGHPQAVTG